MKKYTVYLVFEPHGDWHEGVLLHVECDSQDEDDIIEVACNKLDTIKPELTEWAVKAYLILDGDVHPKAYFKT